MGLCDSSWGCFPSQQGKCQYLPATQVVLKFLVTTFLKSEKEQVKLDLIFFKTYFY